MVSNMLSHLSSSVHVYWKFHRQKIECFQIEILIFLHISAQKIDHEHSLEPPHEGGSNEYPQSMFLSRNKKNNVYPCKPQFYYIKVEIKGVKIIYMFSWWSEDVYQPVHLHFEFLRIKTSFKQTIKTQIRLCRFAGWNESPFWRT